MAQNYGNYFSSASFLSIIYWRLMKILLPEYLRKDDGSGNCSI
jgi:hypothetical protein